MPLVLRNGPRYASVMNNTTSTGWVRREARAPCPWPHPWSLVTQPLLSSPWGTGRSCSGCEAMVGARRLESWRRFSRPCLRNSSCAEHWLRNRSSRCACLAVQELSVDEGMRVHHPGVSSGSSRKPRRRRRTVSGFGRRLRLSGSCSSWLESLFSRSSMLSMLLRFTSAKLHGC